MADKLTQQQQLAVNDRGGNLLISAAAGSGKTKVLVERLMGYLCDENNPASIDDFLIITYTKAAASELRVKIANRLNEAVAQMPNNQHLRIQLQRLHMANISTVHAFCTDILHRYAYYLSLPSDFRTVDETETPELQIAVMEEILEDAYEHIEENPDFANFVDTQGYGHSDFQVPDIILKVYSRARCHINPEKWLQECEDSLDVKQFHDASETVWGDYLITDLKNNLSLQIDALNNCIKRASVADGMESVVSLLQDTVFQLDNLRNKNTWDAIFENIDIQYGTLRFSKKVTDLTLQEQIKAVRDACKATVAAKLRNFSAPSVEVLADLQSAGSSCKGLVGLVRAFSANYSRLKEARRVMDFGDLEHKMLDLLMGKDRFAPTKIAKEIGSRFREVMVDEYQDTNEVQDTIFAALTSERNNCFMVGDVKQSIYQFRLAEPGIFIDKYNKFVPAENAKAGVGRKILLSNNFRSSAGVIQGVNDVFALCMSPEVGGLFYGEGERLVEGRSHISLNEPEVTLCAVDVKEDTYEEEATFVAQEIARLINGNHCVRNGETLRKITPEDIVILLRSPNSVGGEFKAALEKYGIAYTTGEGENLFETEEISTLISMLRILSNPMQDIPLLAVLTSRIFCFNADELAQMRSANKYVSIYELLKTSGNQKAKDFLSVLEELRAVAKLYNIPKLIEKIFAITKFDSIYSALPDGDKRRSHLQDFYRFAGQYHTVSGRDLSMFIDRLDVMQEQGMNFGSDGISASGVRIMSIHKSKGLEFPVVFLCGLSRNFNKENSQAQVLCDRDLGIGLSCADTVNRVRYPTIAKRAIAVKSVAEGISEEMRVLYVAMTRAMDRLIMTYASNKLDKAIAGIANRMDISNPLLLTSGVSCPGEWVLFSALKRGEAGALFNRGGRPEETILSQPLWDIRVAEAEDWAEGVEAESFICKDELQIDKLENAVKFQYPYAEATNTPSKQTATQAKGRYKDFEVAENTDNKLPYRNRHKIPSFISRENTATEIGNAYHLCMQHIDYSACRTLTDIQRELERLEGNGYLTNEQVSAIDREKIYDFFQSDLGKRVKSATKVLREFKFSLLMDAGLSYPEDVLMQGVVDCAFFSNDEITVIDFKSDSVTEGTVAERAKQYFPQVNIYAEAMSEIFHMPVKEKWLYFFHTGTFVAVE